MQTLKCFNAHYGKNYLNTEAEKSGTSQSQLTGGGGGGGGGGDLVIINPSFL